MGSGMLGVCSREKVLSVFGGQNYDQILVTSGILRFGDNSEPNFGKAAREASGVGPPSLCDSISQRTPTLSPTCIMRTSAL